MEPIMRSQLDDIFDEHKKRTDPIFDKFEANVKADIAIWSKQVANRIAVFGAICLIVAATAGVALALGGTTIPLALELGVGM